MARSRSLHDALNRLAAAEDQFLRGLFLAPALRGGTVQVRIAGVICRLQIDPPDFEGWGVFQPLSHTHARLMRPAQLAERQRYLELFQLVRLIVAVRTDRDWLAVPAHQADTRLRIQGLVPVRLAEDVQLFETIESRFDGSQFWYAGPEPRANPATAAYLRQALERMQPPGDLDRPGLTAEERNAYAAAYWPRYEMTAEARRGREEQRLRQALAHAGAELREFRDRDEVYTVTYTVDGEQHTSVVNKRDLSVQTAGICLSGDDALFDLQSLVGVLREAREQW